MLLAITVCILLANVLAVAFGGLFSPTTNGISVKHTIDHYATPRVVQNLLYSHYSKGSTNQQEMYYLLSGYLSRYANLPPWTTLESYVIPFASHGEYETEIYSLEGRTLAIRLGITCGLVPQSRITIASTDDVPIDGGQWHGVTVDDPCWSKGRYHYSTNDF